MASKRAIFAIVIGILGAISNVWLAIKSGRDLSTLSQYSFNGVGSRKTVAALTLAYCILMALICLLMIYGVVKNRPSFVGWWIVLVVIGTIANTVVFFIHISMYTGMQIFIYFLAVAIAIGIWYPIFSLWRDMKKGTVVPMGPNPPVNNLPPGMDANKQRNYSNVRSNAV